MPNLAVFGAELLALRQLHLQRVLFAGLVANVQGRKFQASFGESIEVRCHRDSRQRPGKVVCEALSVGRRMEHTVDVIEYGVFRDPIVIVTLPEDAQGCVGDVINALQLDGEEFGLVKDTPVVGDRPIEESIVRTRGSGGLACGR